MDVDNRFLALDLAVRHKTREETAANVVKSAEIYLSFLQADEVLGTFIKAPTEVKTRIAEAAARIKLLPRDKWGEAIAVELDKLPNWEV